MSLEYEIPKTFEDIESLTQWAWQQFKRTEEEFNFGRDAFYLDELHAEPPKPRNGMLVRADGTDWNPDSSVNPAGDPGYWAYADGQWILISRTGTPNPPTVPNDYITFAMMQNIATDRILGRDTAGSGNIEELTLSQVLDFIGSAAQGDILYRGTSAWARLAAGSGNGLFLETQGAAANPQWRGGPPRLISSGSLSNVATLDFTIPTNCETFEFELLNWRPATDAAVLMARFSQSGSYLSGASDYAWAIYSMGSAAGGSDDAADTKMEIGGTYDNASASLGSSVFRVFRPSASSFQKSILGMSKSVNSAGAERMSVGGGRLIANLNAIDGIRFLFSTGNIAEGYYTARAYGG